MNLPDEIERLLSLPAQEARRDGLAVIQELRAGLNRGEFRAAEKTSSGWKTNLWVKRGILLAFRIGVVEDRSVSEEFHFFDKDTLPAKPLGAGDGVRVVPGGSTIRDGAYVARNVICMPPMFITIGAYIDEGSMVDSHALVGSCAQIGKRVHLSAAAQIGGVLEPVNAAPVIIEDDVLVGGNCGVYEGTLVRSRAVLGAGTILTRSTPLYDLVRSQIYRAEKDSPLVVPENAVVVPGSRAIKRGLAAEWGLSLYAPVIVKYRDQKTDAAIELEDLLR